MAYFISYQNETMNLSYGEQIVDSVYLRKFLREKVKKWDEYVFLWHWSSSVNNLGRSMWSRSIKAAQGHGPSYTHIRKSINQKAKKQIDF